MAEAVAGFFCSSLHIPSGWKTVNENSINQSPRSSRRAYQAAKLVYILSIVLPYDLLIELSFTVFHRERRVVEGVAAVDAPEAAADRLVGKKKVLLYPLGVYIGVWI